MSGPGAGTSRAGASRAGTGTSGAVLAAGRSMGRVALAATLAAGVVAVARQRREALAVRRGELAPASATANVPVRVSYGTTAQRLAAWVPPAPRTLPGRALAAAWAGPLTVVGLALALLAGRVPRWSPRWRCFLVEDMRGPSAVALRSVGAEANTIGQVVLSRRELTPDALLAHEAVHVRQGERFGPLLLVAYVWLGARYGYRDNPIERAARTGAARDMAALRDVDPLTPR